MYAVIRAGGKQYRVAPGDVIRIEKAQPAAAGQLEFTEVLAVSGGAGQIARPQGGARVVGHVLEQGRGDKILVFHYKRKKQYKKLAGHRQPFTAVRITEIAFDGHKFTAPELPAKQEKEKKAKPAAHAEPKLHKAEPKAEHKAEPKAHEKRAAAHKPEHKAAEHKAKAKHPEKKSDKKHKK
jgi:large subunit ribosomal protein L21